MNAGQTILDTPFFGRVRLEPPLPVAQHKRSFRQDAFADGVESVRCPWQQLLQAIQLEAVNGIAGLRFDKWQRNHPVEEEVIGVAARPRQLCLREPLRYRE